MCQTVGVDGADNTGSTGGCIYYAIAQYPTDWGFERLQYKGKKGILGHFFGTLKVEFDRGEVGLISHES